MSEEGPADGETPTQRLAYQGYRGAERAAMLLPPFLGRRLFEVAGSAAHVLTAGARDVVEENLARVLGRVPGAPLVRGASREAFRSYARYWYDTFRIRAMPDDEFLARMRVEGGEHLGDAVARGTGAVAALPHLGNWDAAGRWVHLQGWKITAVAEVLRPQRLFELFLQHRRELGMDIVPLYDDRKVGEELVRRIAENHIIALVADRDLKGSGVVVEMFGAQRRMPAGPALLSLATGSPLLPCATYDLEDGWQVHIGAPLEIERTGEMRRDVTALTRELARHFERAIEAAPTQWHMWQPAWPVEERTLEAGSEAALDPRPSGP